MIDNPFHPAQRLSSPANDNVSAKMENGDLTQICGEVEKAAQQLLDALCIDTANDPNCQKTAQRVAKMYVHELFKGRFAPPPTITTFPNTKRLDELVATGPIPVRSTCSHHFCPIIGKAWIGIVYADKVAGLSKFNRIVDWFASRPQIQEELVVQIADFIETTLQPKGVAVWIEAMHTCMTHRGVLAHGDSSMATSVMRGCFRERPEARSEFLAFVRR